MCGIYDRMCVCVGEIEEIVVEKVGEDASVFFPLFSRQILIGKLMMEVEKRRTIWLYTMYTVNGGGEKRGKKGDIGRK